MKGGCSAPNIFAASPWKSWTGKWRFWLPANGGISRKARSLTPVHARAAANLPPGHFQLTKTGKHLRLEWMSDNRQGIGPVVREVTIK